MIGRIREVLGLQTKSRTVSVNLAAFAGDASVKEVAGIELNARLVGYDLENATAGRLINFGRFSHFPGAVEHPVVIVAVPFLQLVVVVTDTGAHSGWLAEIKRRARHRRNLSGGNQVRIHGRVVTGVNLHVVLQDVAT